MRELTEKEISEYENLVANSKQMSLIECFGIGGGKGDRACQTERYIYRQGKRNR